MMRRFLFAVVLVLVGSVAGRAQDRLSVATSPPVVVETVPQAGDIKVDPNTNEVRVTFSKRMQDGSWSWSTVSDETNPEITGDPRYLADGKTCVLPVKLAPNRTYGFWLNSENFGNFKDRRGRSAVPYLLVFQTGKAGEKAPAANQ
jgi:RNA polymerase sigma-70 factor (ECF subfamily)